MLKYLKLAKRHAKVAQLVEHRFRKAGVVGSIPTFGSHFVRECKGRMQNAAL